MTSLRTHLALAALLAAAVPLQAQTAPARRFDGGAFVIDLPVRIPELWPLRMEENGDTAEVFLSGERDGTVMVMHGRLPPAAGGDTTLAGRRTLLRQLHQGIVQHPGKMSVNGEAREIVNDERVALRMPIVMNMSHETLYGTADVLVARSGAPEFWVVTYAAQTRGAGPDADAVRVLDTFHLTGGRSPVENAPPVSLSDMAVFGAPQSTADSTAAARLRLTGRFTITLPPDFKPPLASTKTQDGNAWDTFGAGTEEAWLVVLAIQPRQQPAGFQPTLANLRAVARQARAEMMQSQGDTRITGEAREILLPDRVTLRMPAANGRNGQAGTIDISVPRNGPLQVWTVSYQAKDRGPAADSAAARVLDSFRFTDRPRVSAAPDSRDVVDWAGGRWGWSFHAEPCDDSAGTLTVAPDRKTAQVGVGIAPRASSTGKVLTFLLLNTGSHTLRTALPVEGRPDLSDIWDVVRLSRNAFCWHRADWEPSMCSAPLQRCPTGAPSAARTLPMLLGSADPRRVAPPRRPAIRG